MKKKPILYGSIVSPFVRKVWMVLRLKNIDFDLHELIPFLEEHKKELLKINPLGKIPVYQERDVTLCDSSVICAYLEKKYPSVPVYPAQPQEYAQCLWYEEYADTVLMPAVLTVFFNQLLAVKFHRTPDEHAVQHALEVTLPGIFNYLEEHIKNKRYLVGDTLSLADISVICSFLNLELTGYRIDETRWNSLSTYVYKLQQQPIIKEACILARDRFSGKNKPIAS